MNAAAQTEYKPNQIRDWTPNYQLAINKFAEMAMDRGYRVGAICCTELGQYITIRGPRLGWFAVKASDVCGISLGNRSSGSSRGSFVIFSKKLEKGLTFGEVFAAGESMMDQMKGNV